MSELKQPAWDLFLMFIWGLRFVREYLFAAPFLNNKVVNSMYIYLEILCIKVVILVFDLKIFFHIMNIII